jgi:hypothetical protein
VHASHEPATWRALRGKSGGGVGEGEGGRRSFAWPSLVFHRTVAIEIQLEERNFSASRRPAKSPTHYTSSLISLKIRLRKCSSLPFSPLKYQLPYTLTRQLFSKSDFSRPLSLLPPVNNFSQQ